MARRWQAGSFPDFRAVFQVPTIDRDSWTALFADALERADFDQAALERSELQVAASGSAFGYRDSGPASITLWPSLATRLRVLIYNGAAPPLPPHTHTTPLGYMHSLPSGSPLV